MIADEGQYFNFSISTCSSRDDFNAGLRCIFINRERESKTEERENGPIFGKDFAAVEETRPLETAQFSFPPSPSSWKEAAAAALHFLHFYA